MSRLASILLHSWLPAGGATPAARGAVLKRALREPFLHFLVLGALLFTFNEYLEARANYARIEISSAQIDALAKNYQLQYGNAPSAQQLKALVDSFVKEEVFYHEALKLNLDDNDEIIRRRLVQKYEFLQQDLGVPEEPGDAELRAYYRQHAERYRLPEKVAFSHVYFSTDSRGEEGARQDARRVLETLAAQGASRAPDAGDNFPGLYDYAALARSDVARLFGNGQLADEVFQEPANRWAGPFRSGYGWHLVYVSDKQAAQTPPFETVQEAVRRDYLEAQRERRNAAVLEQLKRKFTIVVGEAAGAAR